MPLKAFEVWGIFNSAHLKFVQRAMCCYYLSQDESDIDVQSWLCIVIRCRHCTLCISLQYKAVGGGRG